MEMRRLPRRVEASAMAARVVAGLGLCIAPLLVNAAPARARCNGIDIPITMAVRNVHGTVVAQEFANSANGGTCNGNDFYSGILVDSRPGDGIHARLQIWDERRSDGTRGNLLRTVTASDDPGPHGSPFTSKAFS